MIPVELFGGSNFLKHFLLLRYCPSADACIRQVISFPFVKVKVMQEWTHVPVQEAFVPHITHALL